MLIECQNCQKKLNIPDDKIPFGRPFTFTCPGCKVKNSITVTPPEMDRTAADFASPPLPPPQDFPPAPQAPQPPYPPQQQSQQLAFQPSPPTQAPAGPPPGSTTMGPMGTITDSFSPLEFDDGPEGLKSALIAYDTEEIQELLKDKLTSMGFRVFIAINVRDAVKQLKFGRFQLMLIQEDYYGATLNSNQLIRAVNGLELSIRHDMFIAVIGPSFTSLDDLTAFSLSLDTVININDLEDIERILISGMGHVSKFFSTYNEMRNQRGLD
jgi:hypothetical protein